MSENMKCLKLFFMNFKGIRIRHLCYRFCGTGNIYSTFLPNALTNRALKKISVAAKTSPVTNCILIKHYSD